MESFDGRVAVITGGASGIGLATARQFASTIRVDGVDNFEQVDGRVWRGAAPSEVGYQSLAARGVTTIFDLPRLYDELAMGLGKGAKQIPTYDKQTRTALSSGVATPVTAERPSSLFADIASA